MKTSETQHFLELLKRRVASLRLMAKELRECRESFTSMDLEATREHILYQRGLLSEIRYLDDELRLLRRQIALASGGDPGKLSDAEMANLLNVESAAQFRRVGEDLEIAKKTLRRLNRVYAGLLRRSRRSINVLINVIASYTGTYTPPPARNAWSSPWDARM